MIPRVLYVIGAGSVLSSYPDVKSAVEFLGYALIFWAMAEALARATR